MIVYLRMNIDRFHNQLAISLGYDHIVNNKSIAIKVEYNNSNVPRIVIKLPEGIKEEFFASEEPANVYSRLRQPEDMMQVIKEIIEAAHQSYIDAQSSIF